MYKVSLPRLRQISSRAAWWRYCCRARFERLGRAWRYACGSLSADDAQRIMMDCRDPAGWYPLLTLTVEDTLEQASDDIADHPDLRRLIADGCARVGYKWEAHGDELYEAHCWAIELAQSYAADEGITLIARSDVTEAATS